MAETIKLQALRESEGFFEKYCQGQGLDIGAGDDALVTPFGTVKTFDKQDGDANVLRGIASDTYDFVYSSHCLEHLDTPHIALQNWFRVVKNGGYLIVCVPHRDLYEKKPMLPSIWNEEHKSFWLPQDNEPPHTWGLTRFVHEWLPVASYEIVETKVRDEGWEPRPVNVHSVGMYQIDIVIRKNDN